MLLYGLILFAAAIVFLILGLLIHGGRTELIHDYHRTKVRDKAAYGKAFGRAMFLIAGSLLISGAVALFGERLIALSVGVLFAGMAVSIVWIIKVQRKYNNGIF